ncbi:hypothetical protein EU528_01100 [Candidatus Thorarchaeota archaeon]|nr:MAG: hypothetical protein EU528_01100 [Candidatus Thorarchaeota archaeon]
MKKSGPSFGEKVIHSNYWLIAGCIIVLILSFGLTTVFVTGQSVGGSFAEWESLSVPEEYIDDIGFREIKFINSTHGWLLGYHALLQTNDSGESWSASLAHESIRFFGLSVVTPLNIWASASVNMPGGYSQLFHTTDGGVIWQNATTPSDGALNVEFYNSTHGLVGGPNEWYRTFDSGNSWQSSINWSSHKTPITDFHLSASTIRAATYSGLYFSEDWGLTWNVEDARSTYGLSFLTEGDGWIAHPEFVSRVANGIIVDFPRVARIQIPSVSYYDDIEFIDSEHGWVVGIGPAVTYTPDGGISWYEQVCPDYHFRSVDFINATHGWAAGWRGAVVRTETGNSLGPRLYSGLPLTSGFTGAGILILDISIQVSVVSTIAYPFLILTLRIKVKKNEEEQQEGVHIH